MSPTLHLHICFGIALILGGLTLAEVRAEPTGSRPGSCQASKQGSNLLEAEKACIDEHAY